MHRNIASVARGTKRTQRQKPAVHSHDILQQNQHPGLIPAWLRPDPWMDNYMAQWENHREMKRRAKQHGNELAVRQSLRVLPTHSAEEAMQMADLLDFAPNREVKHRPRKPRQQEMNRSLEPHFDRECAACGEFHPTEEHEVTYVPACYEEHAFLGFGRWKCPHDCEADNFIDDLFELHYAVQ